MSIKVTESADIATFIKDNDLECMRGWKCVRTLSDGRVIESYSVTEHTTRPGKTKFHRPSETAVVVYNADTVGEVFAYLKWVACSKRLQKTS